MPKVFLCHSVHDKIFARRLNANLRAFEIGTWFDEAEMLPGDSLIGKIEEGITASDYLVVILSPNSVKSEWCKRELRSALTFEISGKPLRVIAAIATPCEFPPFLLDKLYVDFTESYADGLRRLLRTFMTRSDALDLPPRLIEAWADRQRPFDRDGFDQHIDAELLKQRLQMEKLIWLRGVTGDMVAELLGDRRTADAAAYKVVAVLAAAYSYLSRCRICNRIMIDVNLLARTLYDSHELSLSPSKIAERLKTYVPLDELYRSDDRCFSCTIP